MPNTTTLAAGATATISLAAGSILRLSGMGTAQLAPPAVRGASAQRTISPAQSTFGPYEVAVTVNVVAGASGVSYYTQATSDAAPAGTAQSGGEALSASEVAQSRALVSGAGTLAVRAIGADLEQPATIAAPVTSIGKLACRFGSGMWLTLTGAQALTQGHTGWDGSGNKSGIVSRTGQPDMLKVVPAANTTEQIELQVPATNLLTKSWGGVFGLWVYVEALPGYGVAGTLAGTISVSVSTNASAYTNGLVVAFNTNQVREGWNFLQFRMRNASAYVTGSGQAEDNPYGMAAFSNGSGADSNILATDVAKLKIYWDQMSGSTLYFDSFWTGFASKSQFILGCDQGPNLEEVAVPVMDSYGWKGYTAFPYNVADTGTANSTVQPNLTAASSSADAQRQRLYAKGWDSINHTVTHPNLGSMSSEALIAYQMQTASAWAQGNDLPRGAEFYASPASSSSRLSEKVIKTLGYKLQRHARKSNTTVTPFGLDNPQHLGGLGWGSNLAPCVNTCTGGANGSTIGLQQFSKIKRAIDVMEAYGDACIVWWHGLTATGDTGTGEDLTGDNLLMTNSAWTLSAAYLRQRELAGGITVCKGMTGFYYGMNA